MTRQPTPLAMPALLAVVLTLTTAISSAQVMPLLELKVMNGTDQPRVNEPVAFGIPVAQQNQVFSLDYYQIVDASLQSVPRQFKVLTRWGGDRSDTTKPIRWVMVSFNANVPPNSTATYHVALLAPTVSGELWAADTLNYIEVRTSANTYFRVGKSTFQLFQAAVVNGTPLVTPGRIDLTTPTGTLVTPFITETVLEEYAGYQSVRAVVRQRGSLGQLKFTCRWFFQTGRSDVTVDFRLENPAAYGLFSTTIPDGQQYFDALYLVQPVAGTGTFTLTTDTATRSIPSGHIYDLQQTYAESQQTDPMDLWTGFDFTETLNGGQVATGNRFKGAVDLRNTAGGVTVTLDRFWQNFPKGIRSQSGELRIGLWPDFSNGPEYKGQYSDPTSSAPVDPMALTNYRFEGGRWKTHRMVFNFHLGSITQGAVSLEADRVNAPLIGSANPTWIRLTAATGSLWVERHASADVSQQRWEKFTDILASDAAADVVGGGQVGFQGYVRRGGTYGGHQSYGWENFGDLIWADGYCSQHYDWTQCFMLGFWRTQDYRLFNFGRDVAVSRRDYNQNHSTNPAETWRGAQFYEKGWWHGNYTLGQASHNWLEGLLMYYVMTGDEASREAAIENCNFIFLNSPKNWSGYYGSRIPGWGIDNLMAAYSYLGSATYLIEAGLGVYRYQLHEQASGGLGCVINPANNATTSWMENIFHIAASKYYLASGDTGVLPLLDRMRNWFKNEICVLPTGTYPNYTLTMVHESWSVNAPGNLHVHHCWSMSESLAYSAVVFNSANDLLWSKTFFDFAARYWQSGVSFSTFNCVNSATFSPITFRPSQYPGTESKVLSNVIRWGAANAGATELLTGNW